MKVLAVGGELELVLPTSPWCQCLCRAVSLPAALEVGIRIVPFSQMRKLRHRGLSPLPRVGWNRDLHSLWSGLESTCPPLLMAAGQATALGTPVLVGRHDEEKGQIKQRPWCSEGSRGPGKN